MHIKEIIEKMKTQDSRSTDRPIFIVVEDQKIYGIDSNYADGKERKEDYDDPLCDRCEAMAESNGPDYPDDCDDCPSEAFVYYRIKKDVPNTRAGFFFTADACDRHISSQRHHYNETAKSYAISACHNEELTFVIDFLKTIK